MKTIRIIGRVCIIIASIGAIFNKDARKKISSFDLRLKSDYWSYQIHHQPAKGCYYSVESTSTDPAKKKTFIIGKNVRPEIGGTVSEVGDLREIEIPKKKAGTTVIRKGSFFIVREVNGEAAAVFFPDARAVVTDALRH